MRELVIHPEAAEETIDAAIYYREYDPGISARFRTEVYAAIERARSQPLVYRCFDRNFRKVRVLHFPYAVVFHLTDADNLTIIAVMHLHREPGYWRERR